MEQVQDHKWGLEEIQPQGSGYFCEDFPSRTTQRCPGCQTLQKASDIASATAQVAPGLLKNLAILSDTIARRSDVDQDNLKPFLEIRKKVIISPGDQQFYYLQVFRDFTNHKKKTIRVVFFSCRPFPNT